MLADAEVPVTTAETLKASDAPSRTRNLKLPATSQRALLAKAQSHGRLVFLRRQNMQLQHGLVEQTVIFYQSRELALHTLIAACTNKNYVQGLCV